MSLFASLSFTASLIRKGITRMRPSPSTTKNLTINPFGNRNSATGLSHVLFIWHRALGCVPRRVWIYICGCSLVRHACMLRQETTENYDVLLLRTVPRFKKLARVIVMSFRELESQKTAGQMGVDSPKPSLGHQLVTKFGHIYAQNRADDYRCVHRISTTCSIGA